MDSVRSSDLELSNIHGPNVVAIVPARSGSKRLPGKNIKPLAGQPLIHWTIRTAIGSRVFSKVIVSTDCQEIAIVAQQGGAEVPGLRPAHLATDTATSLDVVAHVVRSLLEVDEPIDAVMLLQPTSPFRTTQSICQAVELFQRFEAQRSIVSVSPTHDHPAWCHWRQGETGNLVPILEQGESTARSQDVQQAYVYNGLLYLTPVEMILQQKCFVDRNTYGLVIEDRWEAIDIDDSSDWVFAEFVAHHHLQIRV